MRIVQGYLRLVQASFMATRAGVAADRIPVGLSVQARTPFVRDVAARVFGLGAWPAQLRPTLGGGPVELSEVLAGT